MLFHGISLDCSLFVVLYCIVLYCIVLYCIVLYCIVLYCIVLYCIVLYCIVLLRSILCFILILDLIVSCSFTFQSFYSILILYYLSLYHYDLLSLLPFNTF